MRAVTLLVPGPLDALTGGYGYDRRMVAGLRACGWVVDVHELDGSFPKPTDRALAEAGGVLAALPSNRIVLIDGLALGAMPDVVAPEASRLKIVGLVHHPLAAETGLDPETASMFAANERRALAATRFVVVTSRATAVTLQPYGVDPQTIVVVEPGTDPAPIARGAGTAVVQLLCVATFTPRKGHAVLFDALATLTNHRWRLSCVGSLQRDPATAARLRQQLARLALSDRVDISDEAGGAALDAFYDRADVFVLATHHEGYGMVVAEALARGLPVVSTSTGAIPELVGTRAGFLVPPADPTALAAALSSVIADRGLRERCAQGAREVRNRLPTWETAASAMSRALEQVWLDG